MPRLAVLFVLSAASSPCPDLNLIHYILKHRARLRNCQPLYNKFVFAPNFPFFPFFRRHR
ncbi:hypothetical protein DE8555_0809 [Neisseria meningitidis]|uniref:Uncharacterized protein n=1 Tax=Neisseria meningitidis TaxID=487 RepID=A0AAC9GCQ7_NEIME|nr:hypothetical protein DE8555_0809 [Neisseria meningitidis]ANW93474.1 hypothetical protein WUE2121_0811 [Neisseria meningitidis]